MTTKEKDFIKKYLPRLYTIRASIPLTWGKEARRMMKGLIDDWEGKIKEDK